MFESLVLLTFSVCAVYSLLGGITGAGVALIMYFIIMEPRLI